MADKESNYGKPFYKDLGVIKKLAFHIIVGNYALKLFQDHKIDVLIESQLKANSLIPKLYFLGGNRPELEMILDDVMRKQYVDIVCNFPKEILVVSPEGRTFILMQRKLELGIYEIESVIREKDVTFWEEFLKKLDLEVQTQQYSSDQLKKLVNKTIRYAKKAIMNDSDFYRALLRGEVPGNPPAKTYVIYESDLWGGNKESKRSIKTILNFRPTSNIPKNPQVQYKAKIRNVIDKAHESSLSNDDFIALEWCARDWLGLARHYIEVDTLKRFIGIWILPALLEEYGYVFHRGKIRDYFDKKKTLAKAIQKDFKGIVDLFIANLKSFSKRELYNMLKCFQRVDYTTRGDTIYNVANVVEALDKMYQSKKE